MINIDLNAEDQFFHDLRNPINAMLMSAELGELLANDPSCDIDKIKVLFKEIQKQCEQCSELIHNVQSKN